MHKDLKMGTHEQVGTSRAGLPPVKHSRSHNHEQKANARKRQARHHMRRQNSRAFAACSLIHDSEAPEAGEEGDAAASLNKSEDLCAPELPPEDDEWDQDDDDETIEGLYAD